MVFTITRSNSIREDDNTIMYPSTIFADVDPALGNHVIGLESATSVTSDGSGPNGSAGMLQNTGFGFRVFADIVDGWYNTAMGANTLTNLTTGKAVTGIGHQTLRDAIDVKDTTAVGEGAFAHLITGNGNSGSGVNAGLLTGLDYVGREYFNAGKVSSVPKDANNFPTPANYYKSVKLNAFYGPGAGYYISDDNNVAVGTAALQGIQDDTPAQAGTSTTITMNARSVPEDDFYVPTQEGSYDIAIISGTGGGSGTGDTYYNSGSAYPDWPASTAVTAGDYHVQSILNTFKGISYRYLIKALNTRTTNATFDANERTNWKVVCIEHNTGSDVKYYQIAKPISYVGATKVLTIEQDGGTWDTVPDSTSKYRYTQPPYRFKIAATNRDYDAVNCVAVGGTALINADDQDHATALGWSALSNMETGGDTTALGAYAFRFDSSGNPVTSISNATGLGYDVRSRGNSTCVLGGQGQTVVLNDGTTVTSDARQKKNITELPDSLGLAFIDKVKTYKFQYDRDADYTEIDKETGELIKYERDGTRSGKRYHLGFTAQNVKGTLEDLGHSTDELAMYVDYSKNGGVDELALRESHLIACLVKAVQELNQEVKTLKSQMESN